MPLTVDMVNALLDAYNENEQRFDAFTLLSNLEMLDIKPDFVSISKSSYRGMNNYTLPFSSGIVNRVEKYLLSFVLRTCSQFHKMS